MKNTILINRAKIFIFSFLTVFFSALAYAQDSTLVKTTNVTTTSTEEWQTNPLYWIIGGVFVIAIIAILASRSRRRDD